MEHLNQYVDERGCTSMKCEKCGKKLISIIVVTDNRTGKGHTDYIKCDCVK